jgi:hypothetical protein
MKSNNFLLLVIDLNNICEYILMILPKKKVSTTGIFYHVYAQMFKYFVLINWALYLKRSNNKKGF